MATFKFAPNVPVTADIKYIDIVPSEKGGPQIRLKGMFDGGELSFAYLPGKLADVLAELGRAGIVANVEQTLKETPIEVKSAIEVKPLKRQFTMMKEQLAGEKYGTFKIVDNTNGASAALPAPASAGAVGAQSAPPKSYTDLYSKATDYILTTILPKYAAAKLPVTASDVREMVSDVFTAKLRET